MKKFLFTLLLFISSLSYSQSVCSEGLCVIEFNAGFNEVNKVEWLEKLTDCGVKRVDILSNAKYSSKYKIVVVPTLIIFKDGEEAKRFQANIMMTMEATRKDVQEAINELIMEKF
jgi:polyphosphate kinase